MLALLTRAAEGEKNERPPKRTTEKTTVTIEVSKETADKFHEIYEHIGIPVGEQIDRMFIHYHPYDMGLAVQLICEDIVVHTENFNQAQFNLIIYLVLSMLKKSFASDEPEALRRMVEDIELLIRDTVTQTSANEEDK